MGEQFARIIGSLENHFGKRKLRVLEVGCGPGFISLELSRAGLAVVGIDLSPECIKVAEDFASKDPHKDERGSLSYVAGDFFADESLAGASFDAVIFVGALHHFKDQEKVMHRVHELLAPDGIVIAHEPTRDRVSMSNAVVFHLLTRLLGAGNGFFEKTELPQDAPALDTEIQSILNRMRYESEDGEKLQSVNDNDAGHPEMTNALRGNFREIEYEEVSGFYHEVIGGLRYSEIQNAKLAKYIREIDRLMCSSGVVSSTEFYFVGVK
jgi:SAM-dependent methyltransferase